MTDRQRRVAIAPGHTLLVWRSPAVAARPGFIRVSHRSRGIMEIPEHAWNEGISA